MEIGCVDCGQTKFYIKLDDDGDVFDRIVRFDCHRCGSTTEVKISTDKIHVHVSLAV